MSIQMAKSKRRILPRWRESNLASRNADFLSLKPLCFVPVSIEPQLTESTTDFNNVPNVGTASELLSSALLANHHEEATIAAHFLVAHSEEAPHSVLGLAKGILSGTQNLVTEDYRGVQNIGRVRSLLRLQPRNAMLWSDMARHYASLGDRGRAFRCMQTALGLAPQHRWLLRTMARFLVNQDDPVSAHKLLANHPRTRHDPWLIAAEIACAQVAGRAPKFWRQAGDILRFDTFSPIHTTELATAVAMMELEEGARKKAKKLVQKGLLSPTENTLAQVFWAQENQHLPDGLELNELVRSAHNAYEADYRLKMTEGDLLGAMGSAQEWYNDEPFAARPCSDISYIASLIDNHKLTIEMATKAKKLDGKIDSSIELNVIFAKLSSGQLDSSEDFLEIEHIRHRLMAIIEQANGNAYHAVANMGLWQYRFGSPELGTIMYQKAIDVAVKLRSFEGAAMASIFATREAIFAKNAHAPIFFQQSKDLVAKTKSKAAEFYMRKIEAFADDQDQADFIFNPNNAVNYLSIDKPMNKEKVIKIDMNLKGSTIWVRK